MPGHTGPGTRAGRQRTPVERHGGAGRGARGHVWQRPQPRSSRGESRASVEGASPQKCIWSRSPQREYSPVFHSFPNFPPTTLQTTPTFSRVPFDCFADSIPLLKKPRDFRTIPLLSAAPSPPPPAFLYPFLKSCCKIPVTHVRGLPTEKHAH